MLMKQLSIMILLSLPPLQFPSSNLGQDQVFEVIAGVAISVMANHAGNVANPPLEAPFEAQVWSR
jgi:hypothetical protein